jgi:hypothetical protein
MSSPVKNTISQINSFIDEAFDLNKLNDYQLVIQLAYDGIFATVLDKSKNKYIAFEYYSFQHTFNGEGLAEQLDEVLKQSKIVAQRYKKVTCCLGSGFSTLIPEALFEEDRKKAFLKFNTSLQGDELVLSDDIINLGAKNVFALPFSVKAKLDGQYSNVTYHHFSSALLDALLSQTRNTTKKQLFIHIQSSSFQVILIEGKKLLFYNSFNHHSAEDFIYYLLFVCEQLSLNPETIDAVLAGEIERTSSIFAILQKYVRNVRFAERTDHADLSYQLQTFPRHFYFSLFNPYHS